MFGQLMRDADYVGMRTELELSQWQRALDDDVLTGLYSRRAGKRRVLEEATRSWRAACAFTCPVPIRNNFTMLRGPQCTRQRKLSSLLTLAIAW